MSDNYPSCIAVVGLGYTGLHLASAFGRFTHTIGFDIDSKRVIELGRGYDHNYELSSEDLSVPYVEYTDNTVRLREASVILIAVPTPVDVDKKPDLNPLMTASRTVGRNLVPGTIVSYESTVYPGVTEDVCIPILEEESGMRVGEEFKVGYSPERINPGDKAHGLAQVVKIVAAQDDETASRLAEVYGIVVKAGIHIAPDIRTAEAAKVIENIQRDVNIAFMNELAVLFNQLGINTRAVLEAASTKWNFLPFEPGLVGGHCIPVDPYYLTYKAEELGYDPEVILAGRRVNDSMGIFIARETIKTLIGVGKDLTTSKALVLGLTFKENVVDMRNSRVIDMVSELKSYGMSVHVYDPMVDILDLPSHLDLSIIEDPFEAEERYDAVVLAVAHQQFRDKHWESYRNLLANDSGGVLMDVKGILAGIELNNNLGGITYWCL